MRLPAESRKGSSKNFCASFFLMGGYSGHLPTVRKIDDEEFDLKISSESLLLQLSVLLMIILKINPTCMVLSARPVPLGRPEISFGVLPV